MYRCVFAAIAAISFAFPAAAQLQRNFPQNALRGALVVSDDPPDATLNGQPARLAPGSRIRGTNNMLALSGSLAGQKLLVNYTLDNAGLLRDVWILSPEEAANRPWPTTPKESESWIFDPVAQKWARP